MTDEKFYINEEDIIFRSYDEEPEECVSPAEGICMLEEYSLEETGRIVTVADRSFAFCLDSACLLS